MAGPTDDAVRGNWASDPWGRYPYRWFDGEQWSALVFDGTTQYLDPFVTSIRPSTPNSPATTPAAIAPASVAPAPAPAAAAPADPSPTPRPSAPQQTASQPTAPQPAAASRTAPITNVPISSTSAPNASVTNNRTSGARGGERKRPLWVPVAGVVMVVAFSWWLYNLRGDDEEFAAPASSLPAELESAVTTTVAPVTTLPAPSTSAEVASLPPPVVPDNSATGLQDCIDFVPLAAYVQLPWAQDLWAAAGSDAANLPAYCATLTPEQLLDIAIRRDEQELATTGSTSPPPTTAPAADTVAPSTSVDDTTVSVSPTMPPPLPTTIP